jgi:branched-chain amino acid transport system substrate-binding protein
VGAGGSKGRLAGAQAVIASLREHQFNTVLGPIDFDDKGDLTVQSPVWYVWRDGGYMPLD